MDTTALQLPRIPRYRLESVIGAGGMATVFLAVQESLSRHVALKVMKESLGIEPEFKRRFLKEGRLIAQLTHPNIVTVYDIDVADQLHYLSMTYLPGGTLKDRILTGAPLPDALIILKHLADALDYAHHHGIVHRDIKPSNVLFTRAGVAVLADFGIAKSIGEETQLTSTGLTVGSVHYMSPEQIAGETLDTRSDLYSLGILFWQMLTGSPPYQGRDPFAIALMHTNAPIPKLPRELRQFQPILYRLLAKHPEERFGSAAELISAIESIPERLRPIIRAATDTTDTLPKPTRAPAANGNTKPRAENAMSWLHKHQRALVASSAMSTLAIVGYLGLDYFATTGESVDTHPSSRETAPTPLPSAHSTDAGSSTATADLLTRAEARWREGKLTSPPGDNAFELYSQLLARDPENREVKQKLMDIGRIEVTDKVLRSAEQLLRQGAIEDARQMIETGLKINPQDKRLLGLKQALE